VNTKLVFRKAVVLVLQLLPTVPKLLPHLLPLSFQYYETF